jgi:UDP-N-acetylmuramate--alanine ligase
VRNIPYIRAYFVGIGGIGMSAIAMYYRELGIAVFGYDRTSTPLTRKMEKLGISIVYEDDAQFIPKQFNVEIKEESLIVYTPAIPRDSNILSYFVRNGFEVIKRSDALSRITENSINLSVAGTHGKTTISSMLSHVLIDQGVPVTSFVGGLMANYDSNIVSKGVEVTVTEADEYDKSFFKLKPNFAVISSTDPDHLDVYSTVDDFVQNFNAFAEMASERGVVIAHQDAKVKYDYCYGWGNNCDYQIKAVKVDGLNSHATLRIPRNETVCITIQIPGGHNVENATAAFAMAHQYGLSEEKIIDSLSTYRGVKRRFEVHCNRPNSTYIDDYAHHPSELSALIKSLRMHFPERKVSMVFQPHLFSRTRDFMTEFAEVLSGVDQLFLMPVYPARELPIAGAESEDLFAQIKLSDKHLSSVSQIVQYIREEKPELLVTAGAGSIDQLVEPLKAIYCS